MPRIPGSGLLSGMRLTLTRFFQPKVTVRYPEVKADIPPRNRGRLELVTDERGTLKCETCFQCAQACPIECIDMGGVDTKGRYAVHWGPAEQYAERREESAMRRSGRTVSDAAAARESGAGDGRRHQSLLRQQLAARLVLRRRLRRARRVALWCSPWR